MRFTFGTTVLTTFIQKRHDNIDSMCFACCSRDDTFQILKMIIRGHVVLVSAHFVGKAVIGDIYHNKKVGTTNRFFDVTFALAGTETDDLGINQKRWKAVTLWNLCLVSFWQQVLYGILQVSCQPHWRDPDILQVLQCESGATGVDFSSNSIFGIIFLLGIVFKLSPNTFITFALNPVKEFIDFSLTELL